MADKNSTAFPGHDEGTNKPAGSGWTSSGSTFAPLDGGVSGGTTQKNELGTTGKAEGQQ